MYLPKPKGLTMHNLSPAESFRYTGTFSPDVSEMLLEQHEALERISEIWWDVEQAIEGRKPKAVLEHLSSIRAIFEELGL